VRPKAGAGRKAPEEGALKWLKEMKFVTETP
jgi:hypothetical protein